MVLPGQPVAGHRLVALSWSAEVRRDSGAATVVTAT
jgi:hypothetical protein